MPRSVPLYELLSREILKFFPFSSRHTVEAHLDPLTPVYSRLDKKEFPIAFVRHGLNYTRAVTVRLVPQFGSHFQSA